MDSPILYYWCCAQYPEEGVCVASTAEEAVEQINCNECPDHREGRCGPLKRGVVRASAWDLVEEQYRKNDYLHRLAILHQIRKLDLKAKKAVAGDECPFRREAFEKELADLFILLEMLAKFKPKFAELIKERRQRFIEKSYRGKNE